MGLFDKLKPKHKSKDYYIRREVAKETNNQKILADLAMNDDEKMVRWEAIPKVRDKKVLLYVAKNDDDKSCRRMALEKLNEKDIPSYLKDEYYEAQRIKETNEIHAKIRRNKREEMRKEIEPRNRKLGRQCPHCGSYNVTSRSARYPGFHCWDCGRNY